MGKSLSCAHCPFGTVAMLGLSKTRNPPKIAWMRMVNPGTDPAPESQILGKAQEKELRLFTALILVARASHSWLHTSSAAHLCSAAERPRSRAQAGRQRASPLRSEEERQRIRRMRYSASQCRFLQRRLLPTASKPRSSPQSVYAKTALPYSAALPLVYSQQCPDLPTDKHRRFHSFSFFFFFPLLISHKEPAEQWEMNTAICWLLSPRRHCQQSPWPPSPL